MQNAIVAPQPQAVEAGANILARSGNAIDAAVVCALVQGVLDPQMCGLGGYGLLTLHLADGTRIGIDAPALAGARTSPAMWQDQLLRPNPDGWGFFLEGQVNTAGYSSICTPGTVKLLAAMLERWGTLSWRDVFEPAAEMAEAGFLVTDIAHNRVRRLTTYPEDVSLGEMIRRNPEASRVYLNEAGELPSMGETFRNPDLAATLRNLGQAGPEDFYHGELFERMTSDLAANGSYVTREDFEEYALREDVLVEGTYRGHRVVSSGPPQGGATLIAILNIVEGWDLAALGHNSPEYIYRLGLAMKAAFADRNETMADPDFVDVPTAQMLSKQRAARWRERIERGDEIPVEANPTESPHTTHVSVVDAAGNCVALTHSLGMSSGVITPGLGFMYNNSMINFYPLPGHANSIQPRKGRTTGMAPTIVYTNSANGRAEQPLINLGSPGASRIITSNVQVILNVLDFGMSIQEAVDAPRIDCQLSDIRCHLRIPSAVLDEVRQRHPIRHIPYSHGGFALVHALHIDPVTGQVSGAADGGAGGMAMVV